MYPQTDIKEKLKILPTSPGVYRFINKEGVIIYIGKAKNLRNRVSQYFQSENTLTPKTRVMVSKISNIEHTVVDSEEDALLLENNLIKKHLPRYNILLKDSKTYPWICIKNEPFPRVYVTRKYIKDGSLYFGPYSSAMHAHNLTELVRPDKKLQAVTYSGKYKIQALQAMSKLPSGKVQCSVCGLYIIREVPDAD